MLNVQSGGSRGTGLKTPAIEDGKMPLYMGTVQPVLTEGSSQAESRSGQVGIVHPRWLR